VNGLSRDVIRSDPVLRWYLECITLGRCRPNKVVIIWALVIVPALLFAIFWAITSHEERFYFGSEDWRRGSLDVTVGLAFLGDFAVWPFFLLVPLLMVLLRGAIANAVDLLDGSATLVRPEILGDPPAKSVFDEITDEAVAALCYRRRGWRCWWRGALVCIGRFTPPLQPWMRKAEEFAPISSPSMMNILPAVRL
jgi:hypothetical protein